MWRTLDNNSTELRQLAQDSTDGYRGVALEYQRHRTFEVTYSFDAKLAAQRQKKLSGEDNASTLGYTKNDSDYKLQPA